MTRSRAVSQRPSNKMQIWLFISWEIENDVQLKLHAFSSTREDCAELSGQGRTISLTECFRSTEGLMRIEWSSETHMKALLQAAGWPSALPWHKQRGHVPLLSAEGTPPHFSTEQGSLAPYRWSLVLVYGICLIRDSPSSQTPKLSLLNNTDDLLDTTGKGDWMCICSVWCVQSVVTTLSFFHKHQNSLVQFHFRATTNNSVID